tara:strand:+ start:1988 stop:2341 length:354 start_codon:yes stop_codon:yes gene_type:complete
MCQNSKIISREKNGELSICKGCNNYNLIFNNILFQFDETQLNQFKKYISELDLEYWLEYNSCTTQIRKIPVTTFHENLILIFNSDEIKELKTLLGILENTKEKIISPEDIDYTLILN